MVRELYPYFKNLHCHFHAERLESHDAPLHTTHHNPLRFDGAIHLARYGAIPQAIQNEVSSIEDYQAQDDVALLARVDEDTREYHLFR